MGITYIPSPAEGISKPLTSLIEGLDKYMNPNKELQRSVQRAVATNPELLQKMADLEANSPGTMARMGLGDFANVIGAVPQSAAAAGEKATRPRAAEQATTAQRATIGESQIKGDLYGQMQELMKADPTITVDAALQKLTGQTQAERNVEGAKSKVLVEQSKRALEVALRAAKLPTDLTKIDWRDQARQFIDGGNTGLFEAFVDNPDTKELFNEALRSELLTRQISASKVLAGMRSTGAEGRREAQANRVDNFRAQKAFQMYSATNGTADPQTWEEYLYTPGVRERAEKLLAGMKPENEQDKQLIKIAEVNKSEVDGRRLNAVIQANQELRAGFKAIDNAPDEATRDQHIASLNAILRKRASFGGLDIQARWTKPHWYSSGELEYVDSNGKIVPPGEVGAIVADPNAGDVFKPLSPLADAALKDILNRKDKDPEAMLGILKAQDKSKDKTVSAEVEKEMVRAGLIKPRIKK